MYSSCLNVLLHFLLLRFIFSYLLKIAGILIYVFCIFIEVAHLICWQEKRLCCEIRLPPPLYLKMQEVITKEIYSGHVAKKSDAYPLFKLEANKVDRVYDMLVKKGIAQP